VYCVSFEWHERSGGDKGSGIVSVHYLVLWSKERSMKFEEYDFTRNPVVQNEAFFLESKCTACGFLVLVRSIEELVELEKSHRAQCTLANALT
jgi:hypothetical protein